MAENIPFPTVLAPARMTERLKSNTGVHSSKLSGVIKTVENPGTRWEFDFSYNDLNGNEYKAEMMNSAVAKIRGQAKRLHVHNMSRPQTTGTLSVDNLVTNGDLILGNTGWTETPNTGRISFSNGKVRLESGSATVASIKRSVLMSAAAYYSVHLAISAGSSDVVRVTVGGASNDFTGSGRHIIGFSASGNTDIVITNLTNSSFVFVGDIMVARAAQTVGTDQTGSLVNIDGLGGLSDEVIKANDFVTINGELKKITETVVSNSGGAGTLIFEPPMHRLAPDNSLVVLNKPFSKFIMREDSSQLDISPPYLTSFNLSLIEDIS